MPALPWILRAAWLALPLAAGPALGDALDPRDEPLRTVASIVLWLGWAVVVLALLVPRPLSLTGLRVLAPAAVGATVWAAAIDGPDGLALGTAVLAAGLSFTTEVGGWMVNGGAYGDERRYLLRPPSPVLLVAAPISWVLLVGGLVAGPLLLADRQWVPGALAVAAGAPLVVVTARALHALALRWAVFVPAGLVLKDHLAVVDPVLFRRTEVAGLRPAPAGSDALDLTARAPGLALELALHEKVPLVRVVPGRRTGEPGRSARLLFTPTRPGAVLDEARRRRIAVGSAGATEHEAEDEPGHEHGGDEGDRQPG